MGSAVTQRSRAPGDKLVNVVFSCCLIVGGNTTGKCPTMCGSKTGIESLALPPEAVDAEGGELEPDVVLGARGIATTSPKDHARITSADEQGRIIE